MIRQRDVVDELAEARQDEDQSTQASFNEMLGIKRVQHLFKKLGYYLGLVDGDNGPKTQAATKSFQKDHLLKEDGVPGPVTQAVLIKKQAQTASSSQVKVEDKPIEAPVASTPANATSAPSQASEIPTLNEPEEPASVPTKPVWLSEVGEKLLKGVEALRLSPYDDQTGEPISEWVKGATIGYGHLISKDEWPTYSEAITEAQADTLFDADLTPFVVAVKSAISTVLLQQQFDALVMLVFNIGIGAFKRSSVVKMINDASVETTYASVEEAWKAWNRSQGKVNKGLQNRRDAEWRVYASGVYERW